MYASPNRMKIGHTENIRPFTFQHPKKKRAIPSASSFRRQLTGTFKSSATTSQCVRILFTASSQEGTSNKKKHKSDRPNRSAPFLLGFAKKSRLGDAGGMTKRVHPLHRHPHAEPAQIPGCEASLCSGDAKSKRTYAARNRAA